MPMPAPFDDDNVDLLVAGILTGALSRGVVNADRRDRLSELSTWARNRWKATGDPRYAEFEGGLAAAPVALVGHRYLDGIEEVMTRWVGDGTVDADLAGVTSYGIGRYRSSIESRQRWQRYVQLAPSQAGWVGYLVAAAVLSGVEDRFGIVVADDLIDACD